MLWGISTHSWERITPYPIPNWNKTCFLSSIKRYSRFLTPEDQSWAFPHDKASPRACYYFLSKFYIDISRIEPKYSLIIQLFCAALPYGFCKYLSSIGIVCHSQPLFYNSLDSRPSWCQQFACICSTLETARNYNGRGFIFLIGVEYIKKLKKRKPTFLRHVVS